jgi:hypothetical protein
MPLMVHMYDRPTKAAAVNEAYAALTGGAVGRAIVVPGQ